MSYVDLLSTIFESPEQFVSFILENFLPIMELLITSIIVPLIYLKVSITSNEKQIKNLEGLWKDVIRRNRSVNNCFADFKKSGYKSSEWIWYVYLGVLAGIIFTLISLFLSLKLSQRIESFSVTIQPYFEQRQFFLVSRKNCI